MTMSVDKNLLSQVGALLQGNPTTDSDRVPAPVVSADPTDSGRGQSHSSGSGVTAHQDSCSDAVSGSSEAIIEDSLKNLNLQDRKKLGGAARKRFKWLVAQGKAPSEARQLALQPVNMAGKRQRSDDSTPSPKHKKPKGLEKPMETNISASGQQRPSYKQAAEGIKVGVLSANFPETALTSDQMKAVKEAILLRILSLDDGGVRPVFYGTAFKPGWLVITCGNQTTADWLIATMGEIRPWEGASLKAVMGEDLPRIQILVGYFPDSAKDTNENVFRYLERQNDPVNTKAWRVIGRLVEKDTLRLTLSIDCNSAAVLKGVNFRLNYKFSQIHLRPKSAGLKPKRPEQRTTPKSSAPKPSTSKAVQKT